MTLARKYSLFCDDISFCECGGGKGKEEVVSLFSSAALRRPPPEEGRRRQPQPEISVVEATAVDVRVFFLSSPPNRTKGEGGGMGWKPRRSSPFGAATHCLTNGETRRGTSAAIAAILRTFPSIASAKTISRQPLTIARAKGQRQQRRRRRRPQLRAPPLPPFPPHDGEARKLALTSVQCMDFEGGRRGR